MDYLVYKKSLDEREIFSEREDYLLWEKLLAEYLLPYKEESTIYKGLRPYRQRHKQAMNMNGRVEMLAYCLMPTYIYMVVRENELGALTSLMRKVSTFYSMYYNKKHKRSGYVFEGSFKSKIIITLENTINLIHALPAVKVVKRFGLGQTTSGLGENFREWVKPVAGGVRGKGVGKLPW